MGNRKDAKQNGAAVPRNGTVHPVLQAHSESSEINHTDNGEEIHKIYTRIKQLPSFRDLNKQVQAVVERSSWWERYGWEWVAIVVCASLVPVGFWLLARESYPVIMAGMFLMGCIHANFSNKASHLATHGALANSGRWNHFWSRVFLTFIGAFSTEMGYDIHIRIHHPHTNIIGLGDSSTWKVPFLPRYIYMFVAPLVVPAITPLVTIHHLVGNKMFKELFLGYLPLSFAGLYGNVWVLVHYCGYAWPTAIFVMFASRAALAIPYIHVNIFQHIGLPMYSQEHRPQRIYQMSTGVLNLDRNFILDYAFGHAIISCHVEHHLFPKLSDNMCLKVKPIVSKFLLEHGQPYQEDTYWNRLVIFLTKYKELMQNAPPITHFVGIQ
ncbi:fatty acid desaturase 6-like [Lineus longissimus]|uniref:fatty acid desaturase 6-like n=1 Tax=Lineus longissimus TaxID=88925 RepID=UPI002B4CAECF